MILYEEYKGSGGVLDESEFNQLARGVYRLIDSYVCSLMPCWRTQPLDGYGIDFTEVLTIQIDYIATCGGVDALNGKSDFNIASTSTKNFSYTIKSKPVMFNGVPLAPMVPTIISNLLRNKGLLYMGAA